MSPYDMAVEMARIMKHTARRHEPIEKGFNQVNEFLKANGIAPFVEGGEAQDGLTAVYESSLPQG